ncbi:hypothetical protein Dret_0539 [Desulfohalobium retbaense DSM 5692]|uniref:Uncharacterized protein n=1 Tax=Desulfohalobium retbaense (strain ATCC 49708 / DSM 5692 / JCM 16813 / HR100) TaxID=485915 RepID=C8WYS0_DESRD|nr:hypothetical protein Dret_0539 [Desulfohalobium retbaense DSM 5692]
MGISSTAASGEPVQTAFGILNSIRSFFPVAEESDSVFRDPLCNHG